MRIVIPGGSGQVGTVLARAFHERGHDVVVLSRRPEVRPWRVSDWDGKTLGTWHREIDGSDLVVNLAGRSVNCRYNQANRDEILRSRVDSTRVVGEAIATSQRPPRLWLQASTATIYAHRFDAPNDEHTGIIGGAEPHAPDTGASASTRRARGSARSMSRSRRAHERSHSRSAMTMSPTRAAFSMRWRARARGLGGRARRAAVHFMDPRARLRGRDSVPDRPRRHRGHRQRGGAESAPECGVHARASRGVRRPVRTSRQQVDAGDRRDRDANRDGVDLEEPPRRSRVCSRADFGLCIPNGPRRREISAPDRRNNQSCRSVRIGSTRAARPAGMDAAA